MRDYLIFGIGFAILPFIIAKPFIGVIAFGWFSLMNPHRLAYGAAYDFPFAAIIAGVTLVAIVLSRDSKRIPITSTTVVLALFMIWMTITTFFAFEPVLAWAEWNRVMKTLFMIFVTIALINSENKIKSLAWILGLSLGFYGIKGGIFTLLTGGSYRVQGPTGSYIGDNNDMALALVMIIPILWYLRLQAKNTWLRIGLLASIVFSTIAVAGTYSRGSLIGVAAMFVFLWLKSKAKLRTGLLILLTLPIAYLAMPEQWFDRMESISDYKTDPSALGRINSWHFAFNVAQDNIFGGGFRDFTPAMFQLFAPNPLAVHAPHSIYFQTLGEHGFIGLIFFLAFMFFAWRAGTEIIKFCKNKDDLKWGSDLAMMCQVSIIGYMVGGAFLTFAYYDLYYYVIALLICTKELLIPRSKVKTFTEDKPKIEMLGREKNFGRNL